MNGDSNQVGETSYDVEAAKIDKERFDLHREVFTPFENEFIGTITGKTVGADGSRVDYSGSTIDDAGKKVIGSLNADLAQAGGGAVLPAGVDPSRSVVQMTTKTPKRGTMAARAVSGVQKELDEQKISGMQSIVDMGTGQASDVQLGMSDLASSALDDSIAKANNRQENRLAVGQAVGTVAGGMASVAESRMNEK